MKKLELEEVKTTVENQGYKLVNFVNARAYMKTTCPKGHGYDVSISDFRRGRRCGTCAGNVKLTIDIVKNYIESEDYTLITKEYKNAHQKLEMICPLGHAYSACFNSFKDTGRRCQECAGNKKKTIEEVISYMRSFGYQVISKIYIDAHSLIKTICPEGHNWAVSFAAFKNQGQRCSICSGRKTKTFEEVKIYIESFGYKLISKEYNNSTETLQLLCPKNHIYPVSFISFSYTGTRCPKCQLCGTSKPEIELFDTLKITHPNISKLNTPRIHIPNKPYINRFKLDIFNEDTMRAIEWDGSYYHSFDYMRKDPSKKKWSDDDIRNYHEIKDSYFLNYQNIEVLHIKQDDWKRDKQACIQLSIAWLSGNCSIWPKPLILPI